MIKILALSTSVFALSTFAHLGSTQACGNSVHNEIDQGNQLLVKAEEALQKGRYRRVIAMLEEQPLHPRQHMRRTELIAVAHIRTKQASKGVRELRWLLKERPNDPYLLTRLAEGLSRLEKGRDEALTILEKLEAETLVADGEGYAVLARLRERAGDASGAEEAAKRCLDTSANPAACPKTKNPPNS